MNQKGFISIIVIIGVVILAGVAGYFIVNEQTSSPVPIPSPTPTSTLTLPTSTPTPTPIPTFESTPTPTPEPTVQLTPTELKYRLENELGKAIFCGPPVGYSNYVNELIAQFPSVMENDEEFSIILKHVSIDNDGEWVDEEKLAVVREHNRMSVITLAKTNDDGYSFKLQSRPLPDKGEFIHEGSITPNGQINVTKKEAYIYGCPICLASNTLIDTPTGLVLIKDLQISMPIWTMNKAGSRVPGVVTKTSRVPVPSTHQMVHLVLDDGREVFVSPGHPTTDGRVVRDLAVNDLYDNTRVLTATLVPYNNAATYDILPSGETGFYWASGILLDSTLH